MCGINFKWLMVLFGMKIVYGYVDVFCLFGWRGGFCGGFVGWCCRLFVLSRVELLGGLVGGGSLVDRVWLVVIEFGCYLYMVNRILEGCLYWWVFVGVIE